MKTIRIFIHLHSSRLTDLNSPTNCSFTRILYLYEYVHKNVHVHVHKKCFSDYFQSIRRDLSAQLAKAEQLENVVVDRYATLEVPCPLNLCDAFHQLKTIGQSLSSRLDVIERTDEKERHLYDECNSLTMETEQWLQTIKEQESTVVKNISTEIRKQKVSLFVTGKISVRLPDWMLDKYYTKKVLYGTWIKLVAEKTNI